MHQVLPRVPRRAEKLKVSNKSKKKRAEKNTAKAPADKPALGSALHRQLSTEGKQLLRQALGDVLDSSQLGRDAPPPALGGGYAERGGV